MRLREDIALALYVLLPVALFVAGLWYAIAQYRHCRELGLTAFYCIRHAGLL